MAALSQKNKVKLFDYLWDYEINIKPNAGHYNFNNAILTNFCDTNHLFLLGSLSSEGHRKAERSPNFFVFNAYKKDRVSGGDVAHHLLRHIRNSIAHGLISKENGKYVLTDINDNGKETMSGKIDTNLFSSLIVTLKESQNH